MPSADATIPRSFIASSAYMKPCRATPTYRRESAEFAHYSTACVHNQEITPSLKHPLPTFRHLCQQLHRATPTVPSPSKTLGSRASHTVSRSLLLLLVNLFL